LPSFGHIRGTKIAFFDDAFLGIVKASVIGTVADAVSATNANIGVYYYHTIFVHVRCARRAIYGARMFFAMHAKPRIKGDS
jgi:hypothetical protein